MKWNKRLVGKTVLAVICIAALIWSTIQEQTIATNAEKQKYETYSAQSPIGEYRLTEVTALVPIGTEYSTAFDGVVAVYCAAFKNGDSVGVVKIGAKKPYASLYGGSYSEKVEDTYRDWIVEDLTALNSVNQKESLVIRGMTAQMPEFSTDLLEDLLTGSYSIDERIEKKKLINAQLEDITLLDATVSETNKTGTYTKIKELAKIVLFVDAVLLGLELYFIMKKWKRGAENEI